MIFASLDVVEYKELQKKNKQNITDDYIGLLIPFYEDDCDLASYGYIGNNGYKLICIKKIENSIQETSSEIKLKDVSKERHININNLYNNILCISILIDFYRNS